MTGAARPTPAVPPVTLVVPCFQEAPILAQTLERLASWFPEAQLVVVDDGSPDATAAQARAFAERHPATDVIVLPQNQGKGRAVAASCAAVRGARVVIVDADLAYGEASIRRAVAALDGCDMATGDRRHAESTYTVPVKLFGFLYRRHVLGWVFNRAVRILLGIDQRDTQCGLKGFRADAFRRIAPRIRTSRFAFDLEIWLLARAEGLAVTTIPVEVRYESGRSSVRLFRDGARMAADVAALAMRRLAGGYRRR